MSVESNNLPNTRSEQRFMLPGTYAWQEFEALEQILAESSELRITYLDGCIELMTLGESHELIQSLLGMFVETYLIAKKIEFIPAGNRACRDKEKGISFKPDESYYFGEQNPPLALAIEVLLSRAHLDKLERYRRFGILEVWFWEESHLQVYHLQNDVYQQVPNSQLLPNLDLELLVRCVKMPSRLEATEIIMNAVQHS